MTDPEKISLPTRNVHLLYGEGTAKRVSLIVVLGILLIAAAVISAGIGTVSITPADTLLAIGHGSQQL
ncbi:MAG: hypothetical protein Q8R70_09095, partial [Methanoregula sp.]|nr:hypothetical protein [Methanoregula sp.]